MIYKLENKKLLPKEFFTMADINKIEKDLENIISMNMFETIFDDERILPICQERCFQPEQDITALDCEGNLIVFELKRFGSDDNTIAQIFKYVQSVQRWSYNSIQTKLKSFIKNDEKDFSLKEYHKEAFNLESPLDEKDFNKKQKMIIIANTLDYNLKNSIKYWQEKGIEIDFMPYRIYDFNGEIYFEIFTKPFDGHYNPKSIKGVIFDSNRTYNSESASYMIKNSRISSYLGRKEAIYTLKKNDYVFLSHKFVGIIAVGKVLSEVKKGNFEGDGSELYVDVEFLNKEPNENKQILSYSKIYEVLGKSFFHARIDKRPYLSYEEVKILLNEIGINE